MRKNNDKDKVIRPDAFNVNSSFVLHEIFILKFSISFEHRVSCH